MEYYKQYGVVSSFIYIMFILMIAIFNKSNGSELRPSDHGLAYQESSTPTGDDIPEMQSFFNGKDKPIPVAKNLTAASTWWRSDGTDGKSRDFNKGDHVRMVLLVSSLVCGLIGIVMLLTSALVFLLRYRKRKMEERSAAASTSVPNGVVKVDVL